GRRTGQTSPWCASFAQRAALNMRSVKCCIRLEDGSATRESVPRETRWLSLSIQSAEPTRDLLRSSICRGKRRLGPQAGRPLGVWGGLQREPKFGFPAPGLATDDIFLQ